MTPTGTAWRTQRHGDEARRCGCLCGARRLWQAPGGGGGASRPLQWYPCQRAGLSDYEPSGWNWGDGHGRRSRASWGETFTRFLPHTPSSNAHPYDSLTPRNCKRNSDQPTYRYSSLPHRAATALRATSWRCSCVRARGDPGPDSARCCEYWRARAGAPLDVYRLSIYDKT